MKEKTIYKYNTEDGGFAVLMSKVTSCEPMLHLIADEGKVVTNGTVTGSSLFVEIDEADQYYEIDDIDESECLEVTEELLIESTEEPEDMFE
jgi:hypothetical protein